MNKIIYITQNQTIQEALSIIQQPFKSLYDLIPLSLRQQLNHQDVNFCKMALTQLNQVMYDAKIPQPPKSFQGLIEAVVIQLLTRKKLQYVQCLGQQYKDHRIIMNDLNFGKTILQSNSTMRRLFTILQYNLYFNILLNYIIIIPYKGEYIQVAGKQLNQKHNLKMIKSIPIKKQIEPQQHKNINQKGKSKQTIKSQMVDQKKEFKKTKSFSYSAEPIHRFQIFFASSMNRAPGIFAKNMFFDKGIKKAIFLYEIDKLALNCINTHIKSKFKISQKIQQALNPIIRQFIQQFRQITHLRSFKGKITSTFALYLKRYCPLPQNYYQLKVKVLNYVNKQQGDSKKIFDQLYATSTSYKGVINLITQILSKTIPQNMIGINNKKILIQMMRQFVTMKRYQNYKMDDFLRVMDVFEIQWLQCTYNRKYHKDIIIRKKKILAVLISLIVNQIVVSVLKFNFYITEKHKQANKIFYYRKPIWALISKLSIKKFSQQNLQPIQSKIIQVLKQKKNSKVIPQGKLRILPKKGTFRPIITFNRKMEFDIDPEFNLKGSGTLNQILSDTQIVLRNLKNTLGVNGYCVFDNRQISQKFDSYVQKWRSKGCPPLKYFTVDIKKCYDSIDTSKLMKIIQKSNLIQDQYLIIKYNRLYRNKKPLIGQQKHRFNSFFNYKQRVSAVSLKKDLMEISQDHKIPAINIFPAKQRVITKAMIIENLRKICDGSIVSYKNKFWLQKLGIPQGLNVSGVLCSLYFSQLQQQFIKVKDGLLMRLTDDYIYIGPQAQAVKVLDKLLECSKKYDFSFSEDKIAKNFDHPILKNKSDSKQIIWIGKKINIQKLQMQPNFQMSQKVSYAMNVNIPRKNTKGFLKNKLKSLFTNHFASYFKPKLFPLEHSIKIIRLYIQISLQKFYPFIKQLPSVTKNPQKMLLRVLKSSIHQYIIFSCLLAYPQHDDYFYKRLKLQSYEQVAKFLNQKRDCKVYEGVRRILNTEVAKMKNQFISKQI